MLLHSTSNLNGEEILQLYLSLGSFRKVAFHLKNKGVITSFGKSPNHQTIKNNLWRYCCTNIDKSYNTVLSYLQSKGMSLTRDEWMVMIAWNARYGFSEKAYQKYLDKHNLRDIIVRLVSGEIRYPSIDNVND